VEAKKEGRKGRRKGGRETPYLNLFYRVKNSPRERVIPHPFQH
jgi:hypothetical protein